MDSMLLLVIIKWLFVVAAIWLTFFHYRLEVKKINLIAKKTNDSPLIKSLKKTARSRMLHFLIFFSAFVVWVIIYDITNENVTRQNEALSTELVETTKNFDSLVKSQKRLVTAAGSGNIHDLIKDTKEYYTELLTNYYVIKKCGLTGKDDIYIINSAMLREIGLNGIPISLRDDIFSNAKAVYTEKYREFSCTDLLDKYSNILDSYQNYMNAVREVLSGTF
jgi:hypothetical protein